MSSPDPKHPQAQHIETNTPDTVLEDVKGRDFTLTSTEIPPGYFRSMKFLGSMFAIGSAFGCGVAGFTFAAPILAYIDADIGPGRTARFALYCCCIEIVGRCDSSSLF